MLENEHTKSTCGIEVELIHAVKIIITQFENVYYIAVVWQKWIVLGFQEEYS